MRTYVLKRIGVFVMVLYGAATLNFFLPRLGPGDPIRERLLQMSVSGGYTQTGVEEMVRAYQEKFGLDKPLWQQYFRYLYDMSTFDFGYSLTLFPTPVLDLIMRSLPWTIGLLAVTTVISFTLGTVLGALLAWPRAPRALQYFIGPLLTLSSIPYYLLGLVLVYIFAFVVKWFPLSGGYRPGTIPNLSPEFALMVVHHSILPAFSIILAALGSWALGMRGMMVTTEGEDYMTFAEARGIGQRNIFLHYAVRNAMLPQFTHLALSLGHIVSGALLVEIIFTYPGVGSLLFGSIRGADYFVIYGIVFMVILTLGIATTLVDLAYPFLDPRIRLRRA